MKKKNPKDAKGKKMPAMTNTFVPSNLLSFVREEKPIYATEESLKNNVEFKPFAEPFPLPEEWIDKTEDEWYNELINDNKEEKNVTDTINIKYKKSDLPKQSSKLVKSAKKEGKKTGKDSEKETLQEEKDVDDKENQELIHPFLDPLHSLLLSSLPLSLRRTTLDSFAWIRPAEYSVNAVLDAEIRRSYPKKNVFTMREDIKVVFEKEKAESMIKKEEGEEEEEEGSEDVLKDDEITRKRTIYKDFYKYLETKPEISVVNFEERDETDEEYSNRVSETIEKQKELANKMKENKGKKGPRIIIQRPEDIPRGKIFEMKPSNIDVSGLVEKKEEGKEKGIKEKIKEDLNKSYVSWISSIYQFILDMEINDCNTHKSILNNIYPQKNGTPILNPNGHYVIKLYYMGKPRRIDIDDRMPCTVEGVYILPKCQNLTELWPALFTKALLKLNIYKVKHPFYTKFEENVDTSFIYNLTGYHTETIKNLRDQDIIQKMLANNLNDDNFINKKKYILCLNVLNTEKIYGKDLILYDRELEKMEEMRQNVSEKNTMERNEKTLPAKALNFDEIIEEDENEYDKNSQIEGSPNRKRNSGVKDTQIQSTLKLNKKNSISALTKRHSNSNLNLDSAIKYMSSHINIKRTELRRKTTMNKKVEFDEAKLKVLLNYAYSINDFFSNDNFNMMRLKPLDFTDLKNTLKENVVVFKQLTKEEKKEYISRRKALKLKQLNIRNNRVNNLQLEGKNFLIIKLKNDSFGIYKIHSVLPYSESEIFMAKKCILNKWKFPPPSFFDKYFEKYDLLLEAQMQSADTNTNALHNIIPTKKKIGFLDWTRDNYIELIGGNLSIYENNDNNQIKDPILKVSGGNWMAFSDFITLFNTFLILHNPNKVFEFSKKIDQNWTYYKNDCFEYDDDYVVLKLEPTENNNENINDNIDDNTLLSLFIIFQPNCSNTLLPKDEIYNYIIFDIIDINNNYICKNIVLNKFYSTHYLENIEKNNTYYIIIRGGIYEFGYFLEIYTQKHNIVNMNFFEFLKEKEKYNIAEFKITHPPIESNNFYLISRFNIYIDNNNNSNNDNIENNNDNSNNNNTNNIDNNIENNEDIVEDLIIAINLRYPIKYVKKYFKIFISPNDELNKEYGKEVYIKEKIHLKKGNYTISIYIDHCIYSLKENNIDIDIVYSSDNYKIEQVDNIDPYYVCDYYTPNLHNVVFKELIYASAKIQASLNICLSNKNNISSINNNSNISKFESNKGVKVKKTSSKNVTIINSLKESSINNSNFNSINSNTINDNNEKIKLNFELYQLSDPESDDNDLIDKKYCHNRKGKLIRKFEAFNELIIPNITFNGGLIVQDNKKQIGGKKPVVQVEAPPTYYPYLLICYIDDSVDINSPFLLSSLLWKISIFPSDHLCLLPETSKPDQERSLREAWEIAEPGRAQKAKKSRLLFLEIVENAKTRKDVGDSKVIFDSNDAKALREKRDEKRRKKDNKEQESKKDNKKNQRTGKKKDDKETTKEEEKGYELNENKRLPTSNDHCSKYIKTYLDYAHENRTITFNNIEDQYEKEINDPDILSEKNNKINDENDYFNKTTKSLMTSTFYTNEPKEENLIRYYKMDRTNRNEELKEFKSLLDSRDRLKSEFRIRISAENQVMDALKNHIEKGYDSGTLFNVYKETCQILGKENKIEEKLFKLVGKKREEELKVQMKKFTPKDKNSIVKIIEEIEFNKFEISDETMKKLREFIK